MAEQCTISFLKLFYSTTERRVCMYCNVSVFAHERSEHQVMSHVERSGSGVELRTLDQEDSGSICAAMLKPWARDFHSTLHQFTQLYK